jgi:hypothetical protein
MADKDPLDGFRGAKAPDDEEHVAEAELRNRLGENEGLVDILIMSERMESWINQDPVGKFIFKQAQDDLDAAVKTIFSETDLASAACRDAHFRGRVAIAMLGLIEETLQAGKNAAQAITGED